MPPSYPRPAAASNPHLTLLPPGPPRQPSSAATGRLDRPRVPPGAAPPPTAERRYCPRRPPPRPHPAGAASRAAGQARGPSPRGPLAGPRRVRPQVRSRLLPTLPGCSSLGVADHVWPRASRRVLQRPALRSGTRRPQAGPHPRGLGVRTPRAAARATTARWAGPRDGRGTQRHQAAADSGRGGGDDTAPPGGGGLGTGPQRHLAGGRCTGPWDPRRPRRAPHRGRPDDPARGCAAAAPASADGKEVAPRSGEARALTRATAPCRTRDPAKPAHGARGRGGDAGRRQGVRRASSRARVTCTDGDPDPGLPARRPLPRSRRSRRAARAASRSPGRDPRRFHGHAGSSTAKFNCEKQTDRRTERGCAPRTAAPASPPRSPAPRSPAAPRRA